MHKSEHLKSPIFLQINFPLHSLKDLQTLNVDNKKSQSTNKRTMDQSDR